MFTKSWICFLAVAVALFVAGTAQAMLINYDAGGNLPTGAGVVGATGDQWNQSTGNSGWHASSTSSLATLFDSSGTTITGAALTCTRNGLGSNDWAGVGGGPGPTSNPNPFDFSLGYGGSSNTLSWAVSGLSTTTSYDVYVFWGYSAHANGSASVNGSASQTFTYADATSLPVDGRDYRLFSGITATGGVITISSPGSDSNAGISGFQITPEPATMALLGLGGLGVLLRRKRSK